MHPFIESHLPAIHALCKEHGVARLYLFGSARGEDFDVENSDVDVLVEMLPMEPLEAGRKIRKLRFGLEEIFETWVDLIDQHGIDHATLTNPYFIKELEETKELIYDSQGEEIPA